MTGNTFEAILLHDSDCSSLRVLTRQRTQDMLLLKHAKYSIQSYQHHPDDNVLGNTSLNCLKGTCRQQQSRSQWHQHHTNEAAAAASAAASAEAFSTYRKSLTLYYSMIHSADCDATAIQDTVGCTDYISLFHCQWFHAHTAE